MSSASNAGDFFRVKADNKTSYTFKYFSDLFARDANTPTVVNVSSTSWRNVALYNPGNYTATLYFNNGSATTVARWYVEKSASRAHARRYVKQPASQRKAKNVVLFIGDGFVQIRGIRL